MIIQNLVYFLEILTSIIDMAVFDGEWCISMFNIKKDKIKKAKFKIILTGNVNISAKIVDFKRSRWKNLRKAYNK